MSHQRSAVGRFAFVLFLLTVLAATGCDKVKNLKDAAAGTKPEDVALRRVEFIFKTIKAEGWTSGVNVQTAICRWAENEPYIKEASEQEAAVDAFGAWIKEARLERGLESYEVYPQVRYEVPGDAPNTVYVQVKVNGTERWLKVPPNRRISWVG